MKKSRSSLGSLFFALGLSGPAHAAQAQQGEETDHIDAFDEAGPRAVAALASAGTMGVRSPFASAGAEVDVVLGDTAALSVAGAWLPRGSAGYGVAVGMPLFPARVPFHGLFVHPRLAWARSWAFGAMVNVASIGATMGWEVTWRPGFTLRLGAGVAYEQSLGPDTGVAAGRVEPLADGAVGWAF
jgi:hypothetical protein